MYVHFRHRSILRMVCRMRGWAMAYAIGLIKLLLYDIQRVISRYLSLRLMKLSTELINFIRFTMLGNHVNTKARMIKVNVRSAFLLSFKEPPCHPWEFRVILLGNGGLWPSGRSRSDFTLPLSFLCCSSWLIILKEILGRVMLSFSWSNKTLSSSVLLAYNLGGVPSFFLCCWTNLKQNVWYGETTNRESRSGSPPIITGLANQYSYIFKMADLWIIQQPYQIRYTYVTFDQSDIRNRNEKRLRSSITK